MSTSTDTTAVALAITGMTCASCSARIERKLNAMDGVRASVNLATERAQVELRDPTCVDDVIATVRASGYDASELGTDGGSDTGDRPGADDGRPQTGGGQMSHDVASQTSLRRRAVLASVLAVLVVLLAMVPPVRDALGAAGPWWQLALTTPIYLWAAWPFHRAAAINARHLSSTMDTLVSIGITAAFGWSLAAVLTGFSDHLYFETAAVVTAFLLLGRFFEARAKTSSRSALTSLMQLGAKDVAVLRQDERTGGWREHRVPVGTLQVGDWFVVRPGEKVATDGTVVDGSTTVDTSMVTGESMPVQVTDGGEVIGGTINGSGRIIVEATRVGGQTTLAQITRLVQDAQTGKAPVQRLADRVSAVFVPVVLVIAALTLIGWLLTGAGLGGAIEPAVAVLIIACPCALGLATPTALLTGTGRGAQLGILIKGPQTLESTRAVDTVLLDKTGTLTAGRPRLTAITVAGRLDKKAALTAAAAVEQGSEHPIAAALLAGAEQARLELPPITGFSTLPGQGARAQIKGTEITVGKPELFDAVPEELRQALTAPGSSVLVGWGGTARAALSVADDARPTSSAAVAQIRALGLRPYLLTGDNEHTAQAVAAEVGIAPEDVLAGVAPQDKHAMVARLQAQGKVVAMVGDGVNDAAALAQADLGVAMGSGTDVAMDSADVVLMGSDVQAVATSIELSRQTLRVIKQNLAWAFGYNTAAIPLAALGLLNPMIAGAAMAASSVLVVLNSLRLRRFCAR